MVVLTDGRPTEVNLNEGPDVTATNSIDEVSFEMCTLESCSLNFLRYCYSVEDFDKNVKRTI